MCHHAQHAVLLKFFTYVYVPMWVCILHLYTDALESQRVLDPQKLELQVDMSHHVGSGVQNPRPTKAVSSTEPFLQLL